MLTVNTNTTSLITQLNLSKSNNLVKTSIERMSTGFKINRASDDAANMSISKNMECQISGTNVALDNAQQAVNLLQTADGALDNMQANLLRVRDLTVQAMNGTYSSEEKAMIQGEIDNLLAETYKQKNSTMFNQIRIFGDIEEPGSIALASTVSLGNSAPVQTQAVGGAHPVTPLTEEEAIAQGYTCIHNEEEFRNMVQGDSSYSYVSGKYCLMEDIDFSKITDWYNNVCIEIDGEINGNGYSINNLVINDTTNSDMRGLFENSDGTIKNLNLNDVNISVSTAPLIDEDIPVDDGYDPEDDSDEPIEESEVSVEEMIGGLVVNNTGTVDNCSVSGVVKGGSVGGLVSKNDGIIKNSSSSAVVIGSAMTGGIAAGSEDGIITNCSSSGTVTGETWVGGIIGHNGGTIENSYATGDVSGSEYVGGLAGCTSNYGSNYISNSYSTGNVSGNNFVGGLVGENYIEISNSYSTGNVSYEDGNTSGGFVGANGATDDSYRGANIHNSYTTSELPFYGDNTYGTISNCHGTKAQTGVTAHDASWFEDGSNLSFLGSAYDTSTIPPQIIGNERPIPPDPPGPTPGGTNIQFQIGANSGVANTITIDTGFSLNGLTADVSTLAAGEKTLNDIDGALERMSSFRSTIGAMQNRLESITQSLATRKNNMESSHSTIMDTDFALETSKLVQNQILQNVAASLLAQANSNPNIALTLLK